MKILESPSRLSFWQTGRWKMRRAESRLQRAVVEAMEPRTMLTSILVMTVNDDSGQVTPTGSGGVYVALTLRDAITFANAVADLGTITFDPSLFTTPQTITLTHMHLDINPHTGMIIQGPGASKLTISGNNLDSVLAVDSGANVPILIEGMTITKGKANPGGAVSNAGGGISNGGDLTVVNSTITGNSELGHGTGGVYNKGYLALNNCLVSANSDGGIGNYGTAYISGCTITQNTSYKGGGIENFGILTVTGSVISDNSAESGGGVWNSNQIHLEECTISDNTATDAGGGVANSQANASLFECTVTGNSAGSVGGGLCNTYYDRYPDGDAPLTNNHFVSYMYVSHSTVTGNSTKGTVREGENGPLSDGGGVYNGFGYFNGYLNLGSDGPGYFIPYYNYAHCNLTITNSTIASNTGQTVGGIANDGYASTILENSTVDNNSGNRVGGLATCNSYNPVFILNSTICNNQGEAVGQIDDARSLYIMDSTIQGGVSAGEYFHGDYTTSNLYTTLTGETLDVFTLVGSIVDNLSTRGAQLLGSHDIITQDYTGIYSTNLPDNQVGVNPDLGTLGYYGGFTETMPLLSASPAIAHGAYYANPAEVSGAQVALKDERGFTRPSNPDIGAFQTGAVDPYVVTTNEDDPVDPGLISLRDALNYSNLIGGSHTITFAGNVTGTINLNGTELPMSDTSGTTVIQGPGAADLTVSGQGLSSVFGIFSGVSAAIQSLTVSHGADSIFAGGAIRNVGTLILTDLLVTDSSSVEGGGIFNSGHLNLYNVTVSNSTSTTDGGGIFNNGAANLSTSTITGNHAANGAGIMNSGLHTDFGSNSLNINSSTISGNVSTAGGGGISNSGYLDVIDSTVSGNSAQNGGGINNTNNPGTAATVNSSTISGNTAATLGGGIDSLSPLTLTNSTLAGNIAAQGGGAVAGGGAVTVIDSTISTNAGGSFIGSKGGGIFAQPGCIVTLLGTIVDGNTITSAFHNQIADDLEGAGFTGNYNLIGQDGTGSFANGTFHNQVGVADPKLGALALNPGPNQTETMALLSGSPAIDAGSTFIFGGQVIQTDQRGKPRPQGAAADIGAYESQGTTGLIIVKGNSRTAISGLSLAHLGVNLEQGGQIVTALSPMMTLTILHGPMDATINGTTSVILQAAGGTVDFSNLTVNMPGTYTFQIDDGIHTPVMSPPITFYSNNQPLPQMSFDGSGQPVTVVEGQAMSSPVLVDLNLTSGPDTLDQSTVTLYLSLNGTVIGSVAQQPFNGGQASFPNLVIPQSLISSSQTGPGYTYTLVAEDGSYAMTPSQGFTVNPVLLSNKLIFGPPPINSVTGVAFSPALTVMEESGSGDQMTGDTGSVVTLTIGQPDGGSTTLTADVSGGTVTFPYTPNSGGGAYEFTFTDPGYTQYQTTVNVMAAVLHLEFDPTTPPGTTVAGNAIASPASPINVFVKDQFGNKVSSDNVTLSVFPTGYLSGQVTVAAVNGVATFGTSYLDSAYLGLNTFFDPTDPTSVPSGLFYLIATSPSVASISSPGFSVTAGSAHNLVMSNPTATVGASFNIDLQAIDIYSDLASASSGDQLTLSVASGPAEATLLGNTSATLENGVASFDGLNLTTNVAGIYGLVVTDETDPSVSAHVEYGGGVTITAGTPSQLAFLQQPASAAINATLAPITVAVEDQFGNIVTTDSASQVTLYIAGGPSGELDGVITATAQNGVATFNDVSFSQTGTGYWLGASDDEGDTNATSSSSFSIAMPMTYDVYQYATGDNSGAGWTDAFNSLQSALAVAVPGDTIDVATGDYSPGSDRIDTFQLLDGVTIQGGFPVGGGSPNPVANLTVLDGSIGNNYHVVTGNGTDSSALLEGFTIQGGNADGSGDADSGYGGGLIADSGYPTIRECIFTANTATNGGAVYNANQPSTFVNDTFTDNTASSQGGAMYNLDSAATLVDCLITGNSALSAGAIYDDGSSLIVTNSTITGNYANEYDGGVENNNSSNPVLYNDILWNDNAYDGGGEIANDVSSQPTITNSDVGQNPQFVDASNGNYQLQPNSPYTNVGSDGAPGLAGITTDLAGNFRFIDGVVDLGAYEAQVVDVGWTGGAQDSNWSTASNWSDDLVPTQNDDVIIAPSFGTIQLPAGSYAVGSLAASSPIEISGGTLSCYGATSFNDGLTVDASGRLNITADPVAVLVSGGLTINSGGVMDLQGNDLVVRNGDLGAITALLTSGFNAGQGYWNGTGIISSTAANDPTYLSTLGVIQNINSAGTDVVFSTLDGLTGLVTSDVIVKLVDYGDADLSGSVTGNDYTLIDYAYGYNQQHPSTPLTGWGNGDFNYDGKIDGSDYTLIDNSFNMQSASLADEIATPAAQIPAKGKRDVVVAAVPVFQTRTAISYTPPMDENIESSLQNKDVLDRLAGGD